MVGSQSLQWFELREYKLNGSWKKFWEFNSKIMENANESNYSQDDVKCIMKLHQETKKTKWKYEVTMLQSDKLEQLPNNFNTTLRKFWSLKKGCKEIQICVKGIKKQ